MDRFSKIFKVSRFPQLRMPFIWLSGRRESGATLVEYLLVALLVLLVLVVASTFLGAEVSKTFDNPTLKTGISG